MLTLVVAELIVTASYVGELQRRSRQAARKRRKISSHSIASAADGDSISSWPLAIAPAICAGLLLAFSRTLWSYATITEVYTLNTFLILAIFFLMLRWRRRILEDERSASMIANSRGPKAAIVDYDFLLYASGDRLRTRTRCSSRHRRVDAARIGGFGLPDSRTRIFCEQEVILRGTRFCGRVARRLQLSSACRRPQPDPELGRPSFGQRDLGARHWEAVSTFSFVFAEYHGRTISSVRPLLARRIRDAVVSDCICCHDRRLHCRIETRPEHFSLGCSLSSSPNLAYALNYEIAEDKDAYYLPVFIALTVSAGIGFHSVPADWLWRSAHSIASRLLISSSRPSFRRSLSSVIGLSTIAATTSSHMITWKISRGRSNRMACYLTLDWQVASPMFYTREVEERRRDIKADDVSLAASFLVFRLPAPRLSGHDRAIARMKSICLSRAAQTMGKGSQGV